MHDRALEDSDGVFAAASTMLGSGVGTVLAALSEAGIAVPPPPDELPALERDQHVWVQIRQGTDWVDVDPTLVGAEIGQAIATPVTTDLPAIPDELRHRVKIRVTAERIDGTGVAQDGILEYIAFADELGGMPMALLHETPDGLKGLGVSIGNVLGGASGASPSSRSATRHRSVRSASPSRPVTEARSAGSDPGRAMARRRPSGWIR